MSQPMQSPRSASPLTARLYDLEYPRSLGVYNTYQEVQSVVDTLADREFPVQSTLIVGTDLKLMERVTGRKTWPRVVGQGVLSGLWMGLFLGLLLMLLNPGDLMIVVTSVLMGMVFFTVWSVIGYAMTGGKRDFTSMTSTIPMQYELLVEHKHAAQARQILADSGAGPAPTAAPAPVTAPPHGHTPLPHAGTPSSGGQQFGARTPQPGAPVSGAPARPSYGQPASGASPAQGEPRSHRPTFGKPAGAPLHEQATSPSTPQASAASGSFGAPAPAPEPAPGAGGASQSHSTPDGRPSRGDHAAPPQDGSQDGDASR
ncbi:MAG: general stress protein [Brachybacterium sp.]